MAYLCFFFFQAEDGIRDGHVTGVQTCALPILAGCRLSLRFLSANFGTYLAQRAARSRLQPVSAGRLSAAPASPRAVDSDGSDNVRPGQSGNEQVGAGFGYHAPR